MRRIAKVLLPSLICVVAFATVLTGCAAISPAPPRACAAVSAPASRSNQRAARLELVRGDQVAGVELDDSSATRELLELLPVSIELRDSFDLAMVASLPAVLDTGGASVSCSFVVGEIGYSPADGAIAIFHSAGAAQLKTPGIVLLGRVTSGLSTITAPGSGQVTIRRVQ